ncbi:MAG: GNAT family protein [Tissierellales bacterium]
MLVGENLILRGLEYEDLIKLHEWMNDFELLKNLLRIEPSIKYFTTKWYESLSKDNEKKIFAIEERAEKKFVGCIGVNNISYIDRKAELYIYIGEKKYRGKGLGHKSIVFFLHYLFNYYNMNKIYLNVRSDNASAINVYKKIGFKEEGMFREDKFIEGKYIDIVRMSILKGEFIDEKNCYSSI